MEVALQVEEFFHECVLMQAALRDRRPFTDMEHRLLETHLQRLVVELAMKKSGQMRAPTQTFMASG